MDNDNVNANNNDNNNIQQAGERALQHIAEYETGRATYHETLQRILRLYHRLDLDDDTFARAVDPNLRLLDEARTHQPAGAQAPRVPDANNDESSGEDEANAAPVNRNRQRVPRRESTLQESSAMDSEELLDSDSDYDQTVDNAASTANDSTPRVENGTWIFPALKSFKGDRDIRQTQ